MLPEERLVIEACRSALTNLPLRVELDARRVGPSISLADELGVIGLVASNMQSLPDADPLWAEASRANAARNVMLVAELERWIVMLRAAGVEPVLLKGPALAKTAFGSLSRRDSTDLDLIVPFEECRRAIEACRAFGGEPIGELPACDASLGAVTFTVPGSANTYTIDLHAGWVPLWGASPRRALRDEDLRELNIGGQRVRTLGPELSFIHAAAHFWQHGFTLKTLVDVVATLQQLRALGVEQACVDRARALGISRGVAFAMRAADQFVTSATISGPGVLRWRRMPLERPVRGTDPIIFFARELALDRPWRQTAAACFRRIWLPEARLRWTPEWIGADYPRARRMLRPVRLITRGIATLVRGGDRSWRERPPLRFAGESTGRSGRSRD
jgi:hypothetical protein